MAATSYSSSLVPVQPTFTESERLALAGSLAGYRGLTREAYTLDLRQFSGWCRARSLPLFSVRRADIETFARELEAGGRARATVTRRLCTIAGFYKYAVEEELLEHSPAAHVRRPRLDYESQATALDRNELGALLVAAGLGPPAEHALISLLALNGLRVSEATGADIEHLGLERGHRTLVITRKGGKVVTIPLAPRTARAIDLAIGERAGGPLFTAADGRRLDRHGAARVVRRVTRRAGITKHVGPHTLRHAFITAALDAGVPLRFVFSCRARRSIRAAVNGPSRIRGLAGGEVRPACFARQRASGPFGLRCGQEDSRELVPAIDGVKPDARAGQLPVDEVEQGIGRPSPGIALAVPVVRGSPGLISYRSPSMLTP
jgi:site-specific recombinase XerD